MSHIGFVGEIVNHLKTSNLELKRICARAIFHLAEEEMSRTTVRVQGGLGYLMELVKDKNNFHNLPLMAAGNNTNKVSVKQVHLNTSI